jgi:hypothetical protein
MAELALDCGPTGNGPLPMDPGAAHVLEHSLPQKKKNTHFIALLAG